MQRLFAGPVSGCAKPGGRAAIASLVVAVAVSIGACAPSRADTADASRTIAPQPTRTPIAVASPAVASPAVTPAPTSVGADAGVLSPGRHSVDETFDIRVSFAVPEGWASGDATSSAAGLEKVVRPSGSGEALLAFWIVDNLYEDPCNWRGNLMDPPVGPTAEDLATALTEVDDYETTAPTDITIGGYTGKHMELTKSEHCSNDSFRLWITSTVPRAETGEGTFQDELWILDLDGGRLVVDAMSYSDTDDALVREQRAIAESVRIDQ